MQRRLRRLLALFLMVCIVFTGSLGNINVHADYEDGENCWLCGNYHWDNYMCGMCGACSEEGDYDCWRKSHCLLCDECLHDVFFCGESGENICGDCLEECGFHCSECDECFCIDPEGFENICTNCFRCESCGGSICDSCGHCEACVEDDHMHCEECGECFLNVEMCGYSYHCVNCHVICAQCDRCNLDEGLEICDLCGLCEECCLENAQDEGCSCGEYCVEDSDYYLHFCEACGVCFDEAEQCEICGFCEDCCQSESECEDDMCVMDPEYEEHFCVDCGMCFHVADACESCEDYGVLRCRDCCLEQCYYQGCDCEDQCIEDPDFKEHLEKMHSDEELAEHTVAVPAGKYTYNSTRHWKECRYCEETGHRTSIANHSFNNAGRCTVCGYTKDLPLAITVQPKDAKNKVTDLEKETYQTSSHRVRFTIDAVGTGTLRYEWNYRKVGETNYHLMNEKQAPFLISGGTSKTVVLAVPEDACYETYQIRCIVSDDTTVENDYTTWIISDVVTLTGNHNYVYKETYPSGNHTVVLTSNRRLVWHDNEGHHLSCSGCLADKPGDVVKGHTFQKATYEGTDTKGREWIGHICSDCGYRQYYEKHDHYFYETVEEMTDATGHTIRCLYPGCTYTKKEAHTFSYHIVQVPGGANQYGAFNQECLDCDYLVDCIYDSEGNSCDWSKNNCLVSVDNGYSSKAIVNPVNDTFTLHEYVSSYFRTVRNKERENKRITGWEVKETHGLFNANNEYLGMSSEADVTSRFTITNNEDEDNTWTVKVNGANLGGSRLWFEPTLVNCTHNVGTKVVDKRDPICNIDGYTGDTVCKGCGKLIATGNPITAASSEHTGTLTLIPGTSFSGTCTTKGFEGVFRCSACNQKVRGKYTGYDHSKYSWTTVGKVDATCTDEGYTGDQYCSNCGKKAKSGKIIDPYHADTKIINAKDATRTEPGYSGDTYCNVCNKIVSYGHPTEMLRATQVKEVHIELEYPYTGDIAETSPGNLASIESILPENSPVVFYAPNSNSSWQYLEKGGSWVTIDLSEGYEFQEGVRYRAAIPVRCTDTDYEITKGTRIYINDSLVSKEKITLVGGQVLWNLYYEFTVVKEPTLVYSFNINYEVPYLGDDISIGPKMTTTTEGIRVTGHWTNSRNTTITSGVFTEGTIYKILVVMNHLPGYKFPDGAASLTIRLNGEFKTLDYVNVPGRGEWYQGFFYLTLTEKPPVTRIYGNTRYHTSRQIADVLKDTLGVKKFKNIVLVSGEGFADGLSASYLAAKLGAPILATDGSKKSRYDATNAYILENLERDGTVYIIGGPNAIPDAAVEALSDVHLVRYAGNTRYATNLEILNACGVDAGSEVLIATGIDFPDSLSVSTTGLPLILVNGEKGTLTNNQKTYLKQLGDAGCSFTIIGGENAISEDLKALIEESAGKKAERIAGNTRYRTSVAIAERYFPGATQLILGYGENFPDALSAGPLGKAMDAPLILTTSEKTSAVNVATNYAVENAIRAGYVLGGPKLITDEDVRRIFDIPENVEILVK